MFTKGEWTISLPKSSWGFWAKFCPTLIEITALRLPVAGLSDATYQKETENCMQLNISFIVSTFTGMNHIRT